MPNAIAKMYEKGFFFPIIYSLRDLDGALECEHSNVVLLGRVLNILNSARVVKYVKNCGKMALVDIDLVGGLNHDDYALNFIAKEVRADAIISTHKNTIINAKRKKIVSILKVFVYDEFSLNSALQIIAQCEPDIIELLPGAVLPLVIDRIREKFDMPINASGFLNAASDELLKFKEIGVSAIHTGDKKIWEQSGFALKNDDKMGE